MCPQSKSDELRLEILNRFEFISHFFNPDSVEKDFKIQFYIEDEQLKNKQVSFYFETYGTRCEIFEGETTDPDISIALPYQYWLDLQGKKLSRFQIFRDLFPGGPLNVRGNPLLFIKFDKIFGGTLSEEYLRPEDIDLMQLHRTVPETWKKPKKIVILSGSGRSKKQATSYHFAKLFAEGLSKVKPQPDIDIIHLRDFKFSPCKGCFLCWKRDGECILKDDYARIIKPRIDECDLLIYAFPLYFYDYPPEIRKVITRFFANDHPCFTWNDEIEDMGHYDRIPYRFSLFLLGIAGASDRKQFEVPTIQAELFSKRHHVPFLGSLLRLTSNGFLVSAARTPLIDDIEQAFIDAGYELGSKGEISEATKKHAEKTTLTPAQFRAAAFAFNKFFNNKLKYSLKLIQTKPSEFDLKEKLKNKTEEKSDSHQTV